MDIFFGIIIIGGGLLFIVLGRKKSHRDMFKVMGLDSPLLHALQQDDRAVRRHFGSEDTQCSDMAIRTNKTRRQWLQPMRA